MENNYDTIVLSGGGLKGFYILGALQALHDKNLLDNIKIYLGTSIGAIISYLLIIGYTPIEIIVSIYTNKWFERMINYNLIAMINGNGTTSFTPISEALEKMTLSKIGRLLTLSKLKEDFKKDLICTTYNMTTSNLEYLSCSNFPDLPCLTALRMSANIPIIFDRFKYMDCYYIDGGIADNFPIIKGIEIGQKVIGIYLDINNKSLEDDPSDGIINYFFRLLQIPVLQATRYRVEMAKDNAKIINIQTSKLQNAMQFDIESKIRLDMFSGGYSQTVEFLK